jgi:hypothetical protein
MLKVGSRALVTDKNSSFYELVVKIVRISVEQRPRPFNVYTATTVDGKVPDGFPSATSVFRADQLRVN